MIKPMGVVLVLAVVLAFSVCILLVLWGSLLCIQRRAWKTAAALGIAAVGIFVFNAWVISSVAPKGGQTVAQLEREGGRAFVLRYYRYGWLEYPKARFYARDKEGAWTSFAVHSELVDRDHVPMVFDESEQTVDVPGVGTYRIQENDFVFIDGGRGEIWQLPPGIEPGEEGLQ